MKKALVVNFFGAPGSGKSSLTGGLFYDLKTNHHINCEMAREIAKQKVWSGQHSALLDQDYITALQRREIDMVVNQVDVVICDSPLLLGSIYAPDSYPSCFHEFTHWTYDQYWNLNILVNRTKPYDPRGRNQNEQQSLELHIKIKNLLDTNNIKYYETTSNGLENVSQLVRKTLDEKSN